MKAVLVGVEVGGTFTDLVAFKGPDIVVQKVPSTPLMPDVGVFDAIGSAGLSLNTIRDFSHGSTVATNAVLERKGARICFIATAGFRDLLLLQRHDRSSIYELAYRKPAPLVERRDCFEIAGRILADGSVEQPLDLAAADGLAAGIRAGGYQGVAICLLNAYANPAHEIALAEALAARLPDILVSRSSQVAREFREYERASTTALSTYVQPVIDSYLQRMEARLEAEGFDGRFTVMQSNGGRLPAISMRRNAVTALFSGPAAGVVGATRLAGLSGYRNLITFDMGGTSADVCLVEDAIPQLVHETVIDGLPAQTPVLDIVTVGGGGGSIISIDDGGMLRVGPQSAGSTPGPACYGKGGRLPTITDAQVISGAVRPETFLGGRMTLDVAAARAAMAPLAERLDMSVEELADSAIAVVNANIMRAIQMVTTERGRDPRDFVLVPFGGGGPLHGVSIAADLGISSVVIPPNPGVLSAYGLLASNFIKLASATRRMELGEVETEGRRLFEELSAQLRAEFAAMDLPSDAEFAFSIDMRFRGQAFEIGVPLKAGLDRLDRETLLAAFAEEHVRAYGHDIDRDRVIEAIAFRVAATALSETLPKLSFTPSQDIPAARHPLFLGRKWQDCRHISGGELRAGAVPGPTIISGATSTCFIPEGWSVDLDEHENLIIREARQ